MAAPQILRCGKTPAASGRRFGEGEGEGFHFLPFGWGRRRCPGEGLAYRLMGLAVGL
ncbi:Trans-cinnamate 4-monooxygenase [Platanthera zijinensis]|uniref:Trans-cinnamate 4-monooxygenase n=1 Tax=Platanthera zijinensis TaxID=2320716 RepID=A0AAP0FY98_9ASPA